MAYIKTTWENEPSESTPINASNLNKIEEGIYSNSLKADQVGDLTNLETDIKTDIVSSINELKEYEEYSTTEEIKTNKTLNGKPIYRSYVTYTHSATGNYTYNHNLGIETLVSANVFLSVAGQTISSHGYRPNPYISGNNSFYVGQITQNSIVSTATGWSNNTVYAWLEYTKTTD
jgi:hypothetical protein